MSVKDASFEPVTGTAGPRPGVTYTSLWRGGFCGRGAEN